MKVFFKNLFSYDLEWVSTTQPVQLWESRSCTYSRSEIISSMKLSGGERLCQGVLGTVTVSLLLYVKHKLKYAFIVQLDT